MAFVDVCRKYETTFVGYKVPVGAIYGKTSDKTLFVCENPRDIKASAMHVHIMKRSWGNNADSSEKNIRWNYTVIPSSHEIFKLVKSACMELGFIPKVTSYYEPAWRKREKRIAQWEHEREKNIKAWELEKARREKERILWEKYALSPADLPTMRMPSEPMQAIVKDNEKAIEKPWLQYMVDGKGYDISWEEDVIVSKEDIIFGYNGCPVEYESGKRMPSFKSIINTGFMEFETGVTMPINHMKVDQTKCRPGKVYVIK